MTDEEKKPETVPDPAPAPPSSPPSRKRGPVVTYLAVLFAAAFLLLLLAYFMQQRTSEQAIGSLKESVTSIESLDDLIEENQELRRQVEILENKVDLLIAERDQLQEAFNTRWANDAEQIDRLQTAYQILAVLDEAEALYELGEYETAQAMLDYQKDLLTEENLLRANSGDLYMYSSVVLVRPETMDDYSAPSRYGALLDKLSKKLGR